MDNKDVLPAYGYVARDAYGSYSAEVAIKTSINMDVDNPFYEKSVVVVGRFDVIQSELKDRLSSLGAYISSKVTTNTDYILIGDNPQSTQQIDQYEALNENGSNIKAIYKDDLNDILEEYNKKHIYETSTI